MRLYMGCRMQITITIVTVIFLFSGLPKAASSGVGALGAQPLQRPQQPTTHTGESSLVDKETGRVYWRGGPGSIRTSSEAISDKIGIKHLKATILSSLLALALLSALTSWLRDRLSDFVLKSAAMSDGRGIHQRALVFTARGAAILIRLPRPDAWFVAITAALYLAESYVCSTRLYLENALVGSAALEEYVERLRNVRPSVAWKVRCFHYERRRSLAWFAILEEWIRGIAKKYAEKTNLEIEEESLPTQTASLLDRKVVSHVATKHYELEW